MLITMKHCEDIIRALFHATMTVKIYHWQTKNFARHTASDTLFTTLVTLTDQFVETFIGRYTRPHFPDGLHLDVDEMNDDNIKRYLQDFSAFLRKEVPKHLSSSDSDLLNIRDEILSTVNQTLYLFTLQ